MPPKSTTNQQLERIENAIIGNGREGLLDRTARIEENLKTTQEQVEDAKLAAIRAEEKTDTAIAKVLENVSTLAVNMVTMTNTLTTHLGTDHLSVLMKKKHFWVLLVSGFILLHIISEYVPGLWDAGMMFLGLPKLIISIPSG